MSVARARLACFLVAVAAVHVGDRPVLGHHMVVRCNLEEMTQRADRIFLGQCIKVNETYRHIAQGNLPVTDYTFKVESVLKGKLPAVYTFSQLGHPARLTKPKPGDLTMHGQIVGPATMLHGAATYYVGDSLLLFLVPNYLDGTITAPVGAYQGAFFRSTMPSGQELVRNQINNSGLFTADYNGSDFTADRARVIFPDHDTPIASILTGVDIQSIVHKRGPLPLSSLVALVKQINVAHGGQAGSITR